MRFNESKKWYYLIILVAIGVYISVLPNQFAFDDELIILHNPLIRSLSNLPQIFALDYWGLGDTNIEYRPITITTYALNYALHGLHPFGYHLVNVILHALNSLLIFFICRYMFPNSVRFSILTALLFAVHPIHTEAVANVVGRAELLYTFFYLSAWLVHLKSKGLSGRTELRRVVLAGVLLLFGLGSKETSVTFLVVVIVFDLLFRGEERIKDVFRFRWKHYLVYFLITAEFIFIRIFLVPLSKEISLIDNPLAMLDPVWRIINALYILFFKYLFLLFVPLHLSPDYSYHAINLIDSFFDVRVGIILVLLAGVIVGLIWSCRHQKYTPICFGGLFFAVTIAPVANILMSIGTIMGERLLYLPSLGFCLVLGFILSKLCQKIQLKPVIIGLVILILGSYGTRTVIRNFDWYDNEHLFLSAVLVVPNSARVQQNVGAVYYKKGEKEKALSHFQKAIDIYPDNHKSYFGMGLVYEDGGKYNKAIEMYRQVIALNPEDEETRLKLIFINHKHGDIDSAHYHFRLFAERQRLGARLEKEAGNARGALEVNLQLLRICEFIDFSDSETAAQIYIDVATIYHEHGMNQKALQNYLLALTIYEQLDHQKEVERIAKIIDQLR